MEPIFDLFPDRRIPERLFNPCFQFRLAARHLVDSQSVGDIIKDRTRKGIRFLKDHPYFLAQTDNIRPGRIDVPAVYLHCSLDMRSGDGVIHPVERAEKCRFAATRRADESRYPLDRDLNVDTEKSLRLAIKEVEVGSGDHCL